MRKLCLALTLAVGLLTGVGHASAAVVTEDIGTLDAKNPSASYGHNATTDPNFKLDASGQGEFRVNFTLSDASSRTATALTASATFGTALKSFTFGLYDAANHLLAQVDQTTATSPDGHTTFSSLDFAHLLAAGDYYLKLIVTAGNAGQFINGNIAVAAVPVPASLPMFGAVLAGLTIMQLRRRAKSADQLPMA